MAKAFVPVVVDLSHHNEVSDWGAIYGAGIRGIIHKATQGTGFVDPDYAKRKVAATASGHLWGAYHFADSSDVASQVDHFLSIAGTDGGTLYALDWEEHYDSAGRRARAKEMSLAQAKQFLQLVYERTGQRPILYSGSLIKETLGKKADPTLSAHRLWLAQYASRAKLPAGFTSYWLWQYAADGHGPQPHNVAGIPSANEDLNVYGGTDLATEWIHVPAKPAPMPVPERADATVASLKNKSRTVATLVKAKVTSAAVAATSVVAGVTTDATTTLAPVPAPVSMPDVISIDTLHKTSDGLTAVQTIASTAKSLAIAFAINEWVIVALLGIAAFIIADKMLGWRLEEYIWGRWHPKEEG